MIYYKDDELVIRSMEEADGQIFVDEYTAQGWHPDIATYRMRMKDEAEGRCITLIAEYQGILPGMYMFIWHRTTVRSKEPACRKSMISVCWRNTREKESATN